MDYKMEYNAADIAEAFETDDVLKDDELLFVAFNSEDYSGMALVIFERNGVLYEVNGGHCSCNGYEGQWEPEETSWKALAMRPMEWMDESDRLAFVRLAGKRLD